MIQRAQSLWLLIAALLSAASFKVSLFNGNIIHPQQPSQFEKLTAGSSILLAIVVALTAILSLVTIFFYKDHKMQTRMVLGALVLCLISIFLFYKETQKYISDQSSYFVLALIFPVLVAVFLILALRGIRRDVKLLRSLDRLR